MSAFVVGNKTISGILQGAAARRGHSDGARYYWNGEVHYFNGNGGAIGQKLVDENYRSVNYRYGELETAHEFRPVYVRDLSPIEIVKLCHCYAYQACETDDWEDTEAYAIIRAIERRAVTMVDGYDDASWGLD